MHEHRFLDPAQRSQWTRCKEEEEEEEVCVCVHMCKAFCKVQDCLQHKLHFIHFVPHTHMVLSCKVHHYNRDGKDAQLLVSNISCKNIHKCRDGAASH